MTIALGKAARRAVWCPALSGTTPEITFRSLRPRSLRLEAAVDGWTDDGVRLADGEEVAGRSVVVATGPAQAASLLPRALVCTSVLGAGKPADVLSALSGMYGTDATAWERVASYEIADALPAMPPPLALSRTGRLAPGRYVCGDHRATGSVQGALASGARTAREVLSDPR